MRESILDLSLAIVLGFAFALLALAYFDCLFIWKVFKMLDSFSHPKYAIVRQGYTEQDVWREVLGQSEPLHCFSIVGGIIDAPNVIPAGSMKSSPHGCFLTPSFR